MDTAESMLIQPGARGSVHSSTVSYQTLHPLPSRWVRNCPRSEVWRFGTLEKTEVKFVSKSPGGFFTALFFKTRLDGRVCCLRTDRELAFLAKHQLHPIELPQFRHL